MTDSSQDLFWEVCEAEERNIPSLSRGSWWNVAHALGLLHVQEPMNEVDELKCIQ